MNILKTGAARSIPRVLAVIGALAQMISATAATGLIDFRNYIPGVVDAPVFRADGTNRLSGSI